MMGFGVVSNELSECFRAHVLRSDMGSRFCINSAKAPRSHGHEQ